MKEPNDSVSCPSKELSLPLYKQSAEYFHSQFCNQLGPLRHFFTVFPPVPVTKARPQFTQSSTNSHRNNLSAERQLKYLRRAVSQDYSSDLIKKYLNDPPYEPYQKRGNVSSICSGALFWAEDSKLMALQTEEVIKVKSDTISEIAMAEGKVLLDTHEAIYQLKEMGTLLLLRTARTILLFGLSELAIIGKYCFESEITAFWSYDSSCDPTVFVSLFDGEKSAVHRIRLASEVSEEIWCSQSSPIHSGWCLTRNQFVLCHQQEVQILDNRRKQLSKIHNSTVFAGISMASFTTTPNFYALSDTFRASIFDLRNSKEELCQIPHNCEESPPTILQLFHPTSIEGSQSSNQSLLIAHSPYHCGSSLFAWLDAFGGQRQADRYSGRQSFEYLFDMGKIDKSYHPRSIEPLQMNEVVGWFHLDNFSGISLQVFRRNKLEKGIAGLSFQFSSYQRVRLAGNSNSEDKEANEEWLRRRTLDKMVKAPEESYWKDELESEEEEMMEENQLEKRYLRYANLKQFYHELFNLSKDKDKTIIQDAAEENREVREALKEGTILGVTSLASTLGASLEENSSLISFQDDCLTVSQMLALNQNW